MKKAAQMASNGSKVKGWHEDCPVGGKGMVEKANSSACDQASQVNVRDQNRDIR